MPGAPPRKSPALSPRQSRFGQRVPERYIDPLAPVVLRDMLHRARAAEPLPLLHMLACTPDMMVVQLHKSDVDDMLALYNRHRAHLLVHEEKRHPTEGLLAELKTATCRSTGSIRARALRSPRSCPAG